jgi:hypothetical protein
MLKNNLEEQFNNMLPYLKDNSKAVSIQFFTSRTE